jgi:hypothetical protein
VSGKTHSPKLLRLVNSDRPPVSHDIDYVDDNLVVSTLVLDVSPTRVDNLAWNVVFAVDDIANYLDFYKVMHFRTFDVQFMGARSMIEARKLKDRKRPPR